MGVIEPIHFPWGLRALLFFLWALLSTAAQTDGMPVADLGAPFLIGGKPVPIDIADDGVTDYLCVGRSILQGAVTLAGPIPVTEHMLHVVTYDSEQQWQHRQTMPANGIIQDIAVTDMNGDGLDDVLLIVRDYPIHFLAFYRQTMQGGLSRTAELVISEHDERKYLAPFHDASGQVLVVGRHDEASYIDLYGMLLECDAELRLRVVWESVLANEIDFSQPEVLGVLPTSSGAILLILSQSSRFGLPVDDEGWGNPFPLMEEGAVFTIRNGDQPELWSWADASIDTLRQLIPTADGENLRTNSVAIEGMVEDTLQYVHQIAGACGSSAFFCYTWNTLDTTPPVTLVELDNNRRARVVSRFERPTGWPYSLAVGPDDHLQILWSSDGVYVQSDAYRSQTRLPDKALPIEKALATADFDRDGLNDVVLHGDQEGFPRPIWYLPGLAYSPWFGDPEEIGSLSFIEGATVGDLDHDGDTDLLVWSRTTEPLGTSFIPLFWDDFQLEFVESRSITIRATDVRQLLIDDFDGDGCKEVYGHLVGWSGFFGWDAAQHPTSPIVCTTEIVDASDLDGDGAAEVVAYDSGRQCLASIDPKTGVTVIGECWPASIGFGGFVNLGRQGIEDFFWCEASRCVLRTFDRQCSSHESVIPDPLIWRWATISSIDIDADGWSELLIRPNGTTGYFEWIDEPLENRGGRIWEFPERLGRSRLVSDRIPGWIDVDRDGDLDAVVTCTDGLYVHSNESLAEPIAPGRQIQLRLTSANPAPDEVHFAVRAERTSPLSVWLHDITGRCLWSDGHQVQQNCWAGIVVRRSTGDTQLAPGVYFLRVSTDGASATRPFVIVR